MGWTSGGDLLDTVWEAAEPHIPEDAKRGVALKFVEAFEDHDCDVIYESRFPLLAELAAREEGVPLICRNCGRTDTMPYTDGTREYINIIPVKDWRVDESGQVCPDCAAKERDDETL